MPACVLVVDDAAYVRDEVTRCLRALDPELRVLTAHDGLSAFVCLVQEAIDLVLCDLVMPKLDGFKLLALLREQPRFDEVPVILLSGEDGVRDKLHGFSLGASDYVTKPFHPDELCARVRVHLQVRRLQAELRDNNLRLEGLVREDPLTGLKNRRAFDELLAHHFAQATRYRTPLSVVMVDVDRFKAVNDVYGHAAGDQVLVAVARELAATARLQDVVVRFGGEEFALLMPHTEVHGALLAAERHRGRIAALSAEALAGPPSVTASFGVAAAPRDDVADAAGLVARADAALYAAKAAGRNAVAVDAPVVAAAKPGGDVEKA